MYFWIYHGIFATIVLLHVELFPYSKQNGNLSIVCHMEFGLALTEKLHFRVDATPFSTAQTRLN